MARLAVEPRCAAGANPERKCRAASRANGPAAGRIAARGSFPGVPERKLADLRALAQAALEGRFDGERLREIAPEDAVADLQELPGVGPFTAQGIVLRCAGAPDRLAPDERRLPQAVALAYGMDAPHARDELA
jgi:DNA-3-methyladenine glycosylase II